MHVITTANLKGGVGKSSTAINLAVCFHRDGARTLLVDGDSQGTARTWREAAGEGADLPDVEAMDAMDIARQLPKKASAYDVVIIDTPARIGQEARAAMLMSNLVLLPVIPGAADIWALQETLDVLEVARVRRPELEARILLNQADHTNMGALVADKLEEFDVQVLAGTLGHRVAFREAMLQGLGVVDWDGSSTAAEEMRAVYKQVRKILSDEPRTHRRREKAAAATLRS